MQRSLLTESCWLLNISILLL